MKWRLGLVLLRSSGAVAMELREVSFDEKVQRATVVFIGVVEQAEPHAHNFRREFAEVKVESLLKGTVPSTVRLETYGSIAEEAVFVTKGRRYLFILRLHQGTYYSVNGHFAVIPVDGKPLITE